MSAPHWHIETTPQFDREFKKLDKPLRKRVMAYLEAVEGLEDPRQRGKALTANHVGVWSYRVGDYRILAQIRDHTLTVLALRVAHRKDVH